jgi:protease I
MVTLDGQRIVLIGASSGIRLATATLAAQHCAASVMAARYHELAFWSPVLRFREAGAGVVVIGADAEKTYRSRLGHPVLPDIGIAAAGGTKFDAIVLIEGAIPKSSDDAEALVFLTKALRSGAILAALGAGGGALACAGLLKVRRVSARAEARRELDSFGAECIVEPVVIDGPIVTAGSVDDIPAFFKSLLTVLEASASKPAPSATRR